MAEKKEFKARIKELKEELSFYARYGENLIKEGYQTKAELTKVVDEILDEIILYSEKLKD